jgi:hypothetical protein
MKISRRRVLKSLFLGPLVAALEKPAEAAPLLQAPAASAPLLLNRFSVAGFQYYGGSALVRRLKPGAQLDLLREPTNPYDPFAVEIYRGKVKLGYVPRSDNKHISRLLEQGAKLECRVIEADPEAGEWNRVRVEVWMI